MARNLVVLPGDTSNLMVRTSNETGPDPLEFLSGSFRSSPEERRIAVVFLRTADKNIRLRFEFTSGQFVEHTITGAPIHSDPRNIGISQEVPNVT